MTVGPAQWATYDEAARAVRVRPDLIRQWASRGRITTLRIAGRVHVDLAQVRRAEADLRVNGARPGRRRASVALTREEVSH